MTRYLIAVIVLILAGLIYLLSAGSQPFTLKDQGLASETTFTWLQGMNNPVAVSMAQVKQRGAVFYSDNRRFYGTINHDRTDIQVTWYTPSGEQIGRFAEKWKFDFPVPRYFLSPDAQKLIAADMTKRVRIFNNTGDLVKEFLISEKTPYESENVLIVRYCPDVDVLFCGEMQAPERNNVIPNSRLKKMTLEGDVTWSKTYQDWHLNTISLSSDGHVAIASLYKTKPEENWFSFLTVFLNSSGQQIGELPVQYSTAEIDSSGRFAVLLDRQRAYLFDIAQNALVAELNTGAENRLFHAAAFLENDQVVLQEGDLIRSEQLWAYQNISLRTTSPTGQELEIEHVPDVIVYDPVLIYDPVIKTLLLGHSTGWQKYTIQF